MGWTSSADTVCQVELSFPTLQAAMHHADRLGVQYEVLLPSGSAPIDLPAIEEGLLLPSVGRDLPASEA